MVVKEGVISLEYADLKGKRVFVRLDLNVHLDKNQDLGRYQGARRSSLHQVLDVHAARVILSFLLVFDLFPSQLQINLFLLVDLGICFCIPFVSFHSQ
ncbi:unnamed protein product [Linum trigynum]|uniref:phosphoglycerate kinase n=1 Tax=Linum trigynum TaxID=586398 RepID=A0AAV2GI28_9ROSI